VETIELYQEMVILVMELQEGLQVALETPKVLPHVAQQVEVEILKQQILEGQLQGVVIQKQLLLEMETQLVKEKV
jgi:hypothetical protein